jgi:predicted CxxxxCH...CXXCH cytochrome family protein
MNKCGECHAASKNAGRAPSKIHDFSHKTHNTDPRTSASMACKQCHVNMAGANTLRQIQIPPMAACVECHDGSDPNQPNPKNPAWRGTGAFHFSSCLKCHIAGSISAVPLPPTHPTTPAPPGAIQ